MNERYWFINISLTLWIPISWEGWTITFVFACTLALIYKLNGVSSELAFSLVNHWPMVLEIAVCTIAVYWVSCGHVKKYRRPL